jgi:hypothetical protein
METLLCNNVEEIPCYVNTSTPYRDIVLLLNAYDVFFVTIVSLILQIEPKLAENAVKFITN